MLSLICLLLGLITIICFAKTNKHDDVWEFCGTTCAIVLVLMFIALVCVGIAYSGVLAIDDKIALYQEENTKIETQINAVVEEYKKYESETLKEFSPEKDMSVIFIKYPELKTNELVKKQIDTHIENNKKTKELKAKKCNYKVLGWWIFFNIGIK